MKNIKTKWSVETRQIAIQLHRELSITEKDWHQQKGDLELRAAELISGALVQLVEQGDHGDVQAMLTQAKRWLNGELKDPGCSRN